MNSNRWIEAASGLVRYRRADDDDAAGYDVDYYARGVGWTSYESARTSWTAAENHAVQAFRRRLDELLLGR